MAAKEHDHDHSHDHDHAHDHSHDHSHDQGHDHDHGGGDDLPEASVTVQDAGPARKKLIIEIPAERVSAKLSDGFDNLKMEAALPGFRKGRVPMRLLEKRFGTDVRSEVKNQLIGETYSEAVEKHELRVLGEPEIKDIETLELPESGPLSLEIEVEVVPEVTLPDFKGIEVKKPQFEVSDDQVNAEIERIREVYGQFKGVEQAEHGDYITADVTVRAKDAKAEDEPLLSQNGVQMLVPGESRKFKGVVAGIIVEDLGNQLSGKKVGETVTIETTGPARHETEELQEKPVTIELRITGIQRLTPLPVEELMSAMGFEKEEEVRNATRERLQHQMQHQQQQAMHQQVVDALLEKVEMELPEKLSGRQASRILQRRAMEMMYRGASQEDIEQQLAELRASSEEAASRELKLLFILEAVARELDVDVSEQELNGRIYAMAVQQGRRPERMREELAKQGQLDSLYIQLREEKAVSKLLEQATVTEVSADEWAKSQGGEDEGEGAAKKPKKSRSKKTAAEKAEKQEPAEEASADEGEGDKKKGGSKKSKKKSEE